MTRRVKILIILLVVAGVVLGLREAGLFRVDFYTEEAVTASTMGPEGKFTSFAFRNTTMKRVQEFVPPAGLRPDTAEIQVIMAGDFPAASWLPFYKSGESTVVAVYRVYFDGMAIGDTFYGVFTSKRVVKGLCSRRTYRELAFQQAEASISKQVEKVLKRPESAAK